MPFYEVVVDFGGTAVYTQEAGSREEAEQLVERRVRNDMDWMGSNVDYTSILDVTELPE